MQNHQADRRHAAEGHTAGREVSTVRQQPGAEVRPLWRVCGLQQLSDLQAREAEDYRRAVPELHARRSGGAPLQARSNVLWLQSLSRVRLRRLGETDSREVSRLWQQLPH